MIPYIYIYHIVEFGVRDSICLDLSPNDMLFYLLLSAFPERVEKPESRHEGYCTCDFPCPFGAGQGGFTTSSPWGVHGVAFLDGA